MTQSPLTSSQLETVKGDKFMPEGLICNQIMFDTAVQLMESRLSLTQEVAARFVNCTFAEQPGAEETITSLLHIPV